jgi:hypothetical protein
MAAASRVLDEEDVAATKAAALSAAHLDLDLAVEQDDVLALGRPMPIVVVIRWSLPKCDSPSGVS